MKIRLFKKDGVFVPAFDDDYEKSKTLKAGQIYSCNVVQLRNVEKNELYHKLIDVAWDCLNEKQEEFFGKNGKKAFRKSLEITAGYFEPVYNLKSGELQKAPVSTSFDSMSQQEFDELYVGVLDVLRAVFTRSMMSEEEFDNLFGSFY